MPKVYSSFPYFDDYNEDKQFQQILFKPGRAVQARELNQLQTIGQAQIERFGSHVFKDGSIVNDCPFVLDKLSFVKINDLDILSSVVDVSAILRGFTLTGLTSGVTGYVVTTLDGVQTAVNTKTLYFKYTSGNDTTKTFVNNEQIEVRNTDGLLVSTVVALSSNSVGLGSSFTLGDGIVLIEGYFLKHLSQTVILDRYTTAPSAKVGLSVVETIENSGNDESLLDPALGSSNYLADGADRSKISTLLVKKNLDDEDSENFYLLYEIVDGETRRKFDEAQYNKLQDELATRTYEESGNYTVRPFTARVREHLNTGSNGGLYYANTNPLFTGNISGNANLLLVGVEPGIGYVKGYRVRSYLTEYIPVEKGIAVESEDQQPISFGYGNYIEIKEIAGPWDVDNNVKISLRSANARAVTTQTYGGTGAPGSEIGTARVKSIAYESGTIGLADCRYRLYLYDVNLTANVPFANVQSVYFNAPSGSDSIADTVLISNSATIQEQNFDTSLFRFPQLALKKLRDSNGSIDNAFEFKKTFDVTIAVDGTFSVSSSIASETLPFGLGALNATQKRENFVLVLDQAGTTTNLTGNVTVTLGSNVITGNSTTFTTQLKAGDRITTAGGNTYRIEGITSATSANITINGLGTETDVSYQKALAIGEYIDLSVTGSAGTNRSVTVSSATSADIDIKENLTSTIDAKLIVNLQRTNGQEIKKILRKDRYVKIDCSTAGTAGPFNLGFSDIFRVTGIFHGTTYSESNTNVSNDFILDPGQRDTHYTHGRLIKKPSSTLNLTASSRLLIKIDYFFHDTSTGVGFFSIDSYPVDDTETTPNTIRIEQIPVYFSPLSGEAYDLRDTLDIRTRFTDTASDATTIAGASINPAAASTLTIPSGGLRTGVPNEEFITDLEYYLSRIDLLYIDKSGDFGVVKGLYSIVPPISPSLPESLTLAHITIPPYPSLSPQASRIANRGDYVTNVIQIDNKRYTMSNIGAINQRVNRLEYYSALNFLEGEAKDKTIPSDVTGLDRFKNGFLVDNFRGHSIGNVNDINYRCSIDPKLGELRPRFNIDNLDLKFNSALSTNVVRAPRDALLNVTSVTGTVAVGQTLTQSSITGTVIHVVGSKIFLSSVSGTFTAGSFSTPTASGTISSIVVPQQGDLLSLPYNHTLFARNPFATKPRNCVGELLFIWNGEITLTPPADNWTDTINNPDVIVNFDNNLDNWLALEDAWGTQWNDWETNWSGTTTTSTETVSLFTGANTVRGVGRRATTQEITLLAQTQGQGLPAGAFVADVTTTTTFEDTITSYLSTEERQSRSGRSLNVVPETVNYDLGNKVVDVSIVPFIRSQNISFSASRLKPNTRMFAFFDNENVSSYCRPNSGSFGDPLITNSQGVLEGVFRIPNDSSLRFRIGTKIFKLVDDNLNRFNFLTTSAAETFTAFGIQQTQEKTILSTRQARIGFDTELDSRTVNTSSVTTETVVRTEETCEQIFYDPLAQTFFVQNTDKQGLFITKLELFFRTKSSTLPITVQIREVVNGFPGPRIIPFGSVTVQAADVNVSEDASAPTLFTFPSPIYLLDNVEYCFVILPAGNNPDYNIWVSTLGENQLGTTNRVSEQPYVGMLFSSANNRTWTPVQSEDIKFNLYRADFQTNTTGTITIDNDDSDFVLLSNLSQGLLLNGDEVRYSSGTGKVIEFNPRNFVLKILKDNASARIRTRVDGTGNISANTSSNVITGINTLFNTEVYANAVIYSEETSTRLGKVINISNDTSLTIDSVSPENLTGNAFIIYDEIVNISNAQIKATVENINDKLLNLFHTNLSFLPFTSTEYNVRYKIRDSSTNTIGSFKDFTLNENYYLESEAKIASNSNEDQLYSNTKSYTTELTFRTSNKFVSPVFDLSRMSSIIVHNEINNDSTGENLNAGNALCRYISKVVTLDQGQDAEDLRIFVSAFKPPNTEIKVYARMSNASDPTPFNDLEYVELERVTSSIVTSNKNISNDYKEFEYRLPASVMTGPEGEFGYTSNSNNYFGFKRFSVKIILLSTNTSLVPKVKDYRAIALQL